MAIKSSKTTVINGKSLGHWTEHLSSLLSFLPLLATTTSTSATSTASSALSRGWCSTRIVCPTLQFGYQIGHHQNHSVPGGKKHTSRINCLCVSNAIPPSLPDALTYWGIQRGRGCHRRSSSENEFFHAHFDLCWGLEDTSCSPPPPDVR